MHKGVPAVSASEQSRQEWARESALFFVVPLKGWGVMSCFMLCLFSHVTLIILRETPGQAHTVPRAEEEPRRLVDDKNPTWEEGGASYHRP